MPGNNVTKQQHVLDLLGGMLDLQQSCMQGCIEMAIAVSSARVCVTIGLSEDLTLTHIFLSRLRSS